MMSPPALLSCSGPFGPFGYDSCRTQPASRRIPAAFERSLGTTRPGKGEQYRDGDEQLSHWISLAIIDMAGRARAALGYREEPLTRLFRSAPSPATREGLQVL
jgi:hypothetical protein